MFAAALGVVGRVPKVRIRGHIQPQTTVHLDSPSYLGLSHHRCVDRTCRTNRIDNLSAIGS
jgi:hypothetical protein